MTDCSEMLSFEELDGDVFQNIEQLPSLSHASLVDLLADDAAIDLSFLIEADKLPLPELLPKEIHPRHRKRCGFANCEKNARFKGFCTQHGGRRYCSEPECTRVPQIGSKCASHGGSRPCSVEGCKKAAQSKGLCKTHGGGMRCQTPGCTKAVTSNGHCRTHGGGRKCSIANCTKWAQKDKLCTYHFKTNVIL